MGSTDAAAKNPITALKTMQCFRPDVVVTDSVFPDTSTDGLSLIRRIRGHAENPHPAIVVISGLSRPEAQERARDLSPIDS
jgi:PleD family two-component response regulator